MPGENASSIEFAREALTRIREEVSRVIVGKRREVEVILATLLSGGHVLLEGLPGTAKTLIASSIASVMGLEFKRVQGAPDLLPSDIIGTMVFDTSTSSFKFRPGPIFANIVLVDEINRMPPKTQSALLEAMQERQVTIEGRRYELPTPFMVIATMNPVEVEGVFPLSEAQVDRFTAIVRIGYPTREELVEILRRVEEIEAASLQPVVGREEIMRIGEAVKKIHVNDNILAYIALIVETIASHTDVQLGPSPRGAIALLKLSKAFALMEGRSYTTPDDVKRAALPALSHRIVLREDALARGMNADDVIAEALERVEPP